MCPASEASVVTDIMTAEVGALNEDQRKLRLKRHEFAFDTAIEMIDAGAGDGDIDTEEAEYLTKVVRDLIPGPLTGTAGVAEVTAWSAAAASLRAAAITAYCERRICCGATGDFLRQAGLGQMTVAEELSRD